MEEKTKKEICDTLAVLFRGCLTQNDLRRCVHFNVTVCGTYVGCVCIFVSVCSVVCSVLCSVVYSVMCGVVCRVVCSVMCGVVCGV